MYGYLHANADKVLTGTLSKSDRKHLKIIAWPGADLNGDFMPTKSTDGFFVELAGRGGRGFPLAWGSHKQGSTAMHTAEAETVSLAQCCRQELIPLQIPLQAMLGEAVDCVVKADNAACIIAVTKGYFPSLRHLKRTQRIASGHPHEIFFEDEHHDGSATTDGKFTLEKAATADHKGDLFTKELHPAQFNHALDFIRIGCKAIAPPPGRRSRSGRTSRCSGEQLCPSPPSSADGGAAWATRRRRRRRRRPPRSTSRRPRRRQPPRSSSRINRPRRTRRRRTRTERHPRRLVGRAPSTSGARSRRFHLAGAGGQFRRNSDAEDGPAEDAPAEPLRQQQHREAPGAGMEAAPAGTPLARACDDYDDCDDCDDGLDTAAAGAPQARLLGAAGAPALGRARARLNGSPLAALSTEPESSFTSHDFSKEGSVVFRVAPCPL